MDNAYVRGLKIQKKSVVKRLYAAACFVLVAALLVASVSYAWLTLSFAPEVSNVVTTIGANGNLEIALGKNIGASKAGDSFEKSDVTLANRTWGNIIDLTDESYGLQAITLRPAILNSAGGAVNMLHPLAYPIYGTDGRVEHIYANNMFAGTYNGSQFITTPDDYGVHGIGTTSYHSSGVEGTSGPLSQRQEVFYNSQNELWTMTRSSYESLCESSQKVLVAYCTNETGISASDFDLNAFSNKVDSVVSAANEELRLGFTLLAASKTTSSENYFMAMDLLEQEFPDYEMIGSLLSSAIQAEEAENVTEAIAELRAFQNASKQLKIVIGSGAIDSSDGYSVEEIAQTVGLIFDLEKTVFSETSRDYWSKVITNWHYRKRLDDRYWEWVYSLYNCSAVYVLTNNLTNSEGQDNDSREVAWEIVNTHTYLLYHSLPLADLDSAISGLYLRHWNYWDTHTEDYNRLIEEVTTLESEVMSLEEALAEIKGQAGSEPGDYSSLKLELSVKTSELESKNAELQELVDEKIYVKDNSDLQAIRIVMTDTIEAMRQYTLWAIAYCACDGQVPDDAYYRMLEIANSTEYIHPRIAYDILCNYGVKPQDELADMVESFEKLEKDLLFLQSAFTDTDVITWSELNEEFQRIFGIIEHRFYFSGRNMIDSTSDDYVSYSSSYVPEDVATPMDVMTKLNEELDAYENTVADFKYKSAEHQITYRYLDEENKQPWAQALGLLLTVYNAAYPFEYGTAEYTLADQQFSTEHSMWHAQGFQLSISVGVGSEDNFNESGLTVRQTRFKEAQGNISYYQNQLITMAVTPEKDMVNLLMQLIAGEGSISLVTISEYLDSLQQQLEYGEAMMYQATLAMAASNYAEDNLYKYAYSNLAPKDAAGMIQLLRNYNLDATVLNAFDHRMELLNNLKALLDQSKKLLKTYQDPNTGSLTVQHISISEAVAILNPVLDTESLTLYGYVEEQHDQNKDPNYVRTVLYKGYGSPSVQVNGNLILVTGGKTITIFGDVYLSLGQSLSGGMLALAKSQTESYTPPTSRLSADDIVVAEYGVNRHSYTIDTNTMLYTLNLRTADTPYSLATNLWTYTENTDYISANQTLVDIYGYSIDLSFRTNAENSDLLLQTEATNRIYNDGEAQTDNTMGVGSYMEFTILDPSYSPKTAKEYMSYLRIVFTDTNTGYIYGYAALDMAEADVVGFEIKAPIKLFDKDTGLPIEGDSAQYLCHMEQNVEKNLTVYVYLDGAMVSQSIVSDSNVQSLSGIMNLQFCSTADLKPAILGDMR